MSRPATAASTDAWNLSAAIEFLGLLGDALKQGGCGFRSLDWSCAPSPSRGRLCGFGPRVCANRTNGIPLSRGYGSVALNFPETAVFQQGRVSLRLRSDLRSCASPLTVPR